MEPLSIDGAFVFTPRVHGDDRGSFLEYFRADRLTGAVGHGFDLAQVNCSVSAKGALRGIHFADVPPGQAKYMMCASGAILDVVVDLRTGSPTFGRWEAVRIDDVDRRAVYLSEGLGHAFMALTEGATMVYLCSSAYDPSAEHEVHPLDPALGIAWPEGITPLLSPKDAAAPTLAQAEAAGILPSYKDCAGLTF
jgi:dTDP-4-dehydrorhamnose 3,5-epimerase